MSVRQSGRMECKYVTGDTATTDAQTYNLYNSTIDYNTKFNEITKADAYLYCIAAIARTYYAKSATEVGTQLSHTTDLYGRQFYIVKDTACKHTDKTSYTWKNTEYGNISFSVQLNKLVATLSEIKVASNPVKTIYEIGEELDTTGLTLTAVYTDGSEKTIATGFTVSGFDSETAGEKTVTVTYEGKTATFTVEVEAPIVSSAKYVIADAEATAGSTVEVYVEIANNPGIVSLRNKISYDTTALKLVKVEDTGMLVGYTTPAATIQSPYILRWADSLATKNNEANGKIVKLTFQIKEDAKEGQYEISVEHVESRNVDGKKITFAKATAKINVIDYVVGDIDGDGEVSDWDAILLNRYLAGWNVEIILKAADIDGDGEVSDWDAIVLERYLAGWHVTLG